MKKKRVEEATEPFDNVQTRYETRNWQNKTPVVITIKGKIESIFEVKLEDLRRLWELNDAAFVERIIVPEPDEVCRIATDDELTSHGYFYQYPVKIFAENLIESLTPYNLLKWYMKNSDRVKESDFEEAIVLYFKDHDAIAAIGDEHIFIKIGVQTATVKKPQWIEWAADDLYDLSDRDKVILTLIRY